MNPPPELSDGLQPTESTRPARSVPAASRGLLIGAVLFATGGYFYWLAPAAEVPLSPSRTVPASQVKLLRPRAALADPPQVRIGGFLHRCNDCHRLFESNEQTPDRLMQHRHIRLSHGINDQCFNCHQNRDRERLRLRDGSTISFSDTPRLCAECHGTTYRDWQVGAHGKTLGAWSPAVGAARRLSCVECHDPHSPAYPQFQPLPPPNTLRMEQAVTEHHADPRHRPLSPGWNRPHHAHPGEAHGDPASPAGPDAPHQDEDSPPHEEAHP